MQKSLFQDEWVNPLLELERVNLLLQIEMKQKNLEKNNKYILGGQKHGTGKGKNFIKK